MKKLSLLFAVCFAVLGLWPAWADDASDAVRAARRNSAPGTVVSTRGQSNSPSTSYVAPTPATSSRSAGTTNSGGRGESAVTGRSATTSPVTARENAVVTEQSRSATNQTVAPRTGTVVQSRGTGGANVQSSTAARSAITNTGVARTAVATPTTSARSATTTAAARAAAAGRSAVNVPWASATSSARSARSAKTPNTARSATGMNDQVTGAISQNYKKCREVFYDCMDEFCANKDTSLRRCACSARINDFDRTKQKLSNVEDKILSFNERLLTVNMDKEDALAISNATEGELAYQKADKSTSKKLLDEISNKLKTSTSDSIQNSSVGTSLSWSLNAESAWDNIDSMMGAGTVAKEGTALYNAALPVCREMVAEVCDAEGAAVAESGYMMAIEQDCNTVAKTYSTMEDQAIEKVREGSALLDMARLDIYQTRNSDDILSCKKKMLDMLSNSSVCGTDLGKCLDNTGKYIDPSTGEAFLTKNLADMANLIVRPTGDQKWSDVYGNGNFVTFLHSKKKYIEPAMENCQDIADQVWGDFVEDALAQIKLAQEKKLEDMRQSCTSLTAQCLTDTAKSISDFDARALSIFGVSADKTVNQMCSSIKEACTALLETTGGDQDWVGGMTEIATDKTYDSIIATCREVGKACIIQTCKSVSGNFGLCENVEKSVNRKSIINRSACWNEVLDCVASAGGDAIDAIIDRLGKDPDTGSDFYEDIYSMINGEFIMTNNGNRCQAKPIQDDNGVITTVAQNCVYDICNENGKECGTNGQPSCEVCRIAEKIWGNCEFKENTEIEDIDTDQNMIKIPEDKKTETLLSWFAENTGTATRIDNCMDTSCPAGFTLVNGQCFTAASVADTGETCSSNNRFDIVVPGKDACCAGKFDAYGNCCLDIDTSNTDGTIKKSLAGINIYASGTSTPYYGSFGSATGDICLPAGETKANLVTQFKGDGVDANYYNANNLYYMVCVGADDVTGISDTTTEFPGGQTIKCNGKFVIINNAAGIYMSPDYSTGPGGTGTPTAYPTSPANHFHYEIKGRTCVWNLAQRKWGTVTEGVWTEDADCEKFFDGYPDKDNNNVKIKFGFE